MTVWLVLFLLECALVELALAEGADKVLWVVLAIHGGDAAASDRLVTAGAQRPTMSMEVCLAVWKTVMLKEVTIAKRHSALLQMHNSKLPTVITPNYHNISAGSTR